MVSGIYPRHTLDDTDYGGFAYWGKKDPENSSAAMPFEDDEAQKLWNRCREIYLV